MQTEETASILMLRQQGFLFAFLAFLLAFSFVFMLSDTIYFFR